jgi:hypothetical protein
MTRENSAMQTCIFCGARENSLYKYIGFKQVCSLLARQQAAGISDPVLSLMCNMMYERDYHAARSLLRPFGSECRAEREAEAAESDVEQAGEAEAVDKEAGDEEAGDEEAGDEEAADEEDEEAADEEAGEDEDTFLETCMCCYYFVSRRKTRRVVPLPMQNLLWYVRMLEACEGSKCDSRILLRLVRTVSKPGNIYARLFDQAELAGMAEIRDRKDLALASASTRDFHEQGADSFCVKRHIAELWLANNGGGLLLPHAHAADLLRSHNAA